MPTTPRATRAATGADGRRPDLYRPVVAVGGGGHAGSVFGMSACRWAYVGRSRVAGSSVGFGGRHRKDCWPLGVMPNESIQRRSSVERTKSPRSTWSCSWISTRSAGRSAGVHHAANHAAPHVRHAVMLAGVSPSGGGGNAACDHDGAGAERNSPRAGAARRTRSGFGGGPGISGRLPHDFRSRTHCETRWRRAGVVSS